MNFPIHLHICLEILYVEKGELLVQVGDREFVLQSGGLALIFPHIVHAYKTLSEPKDTKLLIVICQPEIAGDLSDSLLSFSPEDPIIRKEILHSDIVYAMTSLMTADREGAKEPLVKAFTQLILARALPHLTLVKNKESLSSDITVRVVIYIATHFLEEITLESMSKELGVCRYYLSRVFSEKIHVGFNRYVNHLRVSYAKNLLKSTNKSILNIGLDSGFESQRTFNRVFKQVCDSTPKEFRKENGYQKTGMQLCDNRNTEYV